MRASSEAGGGQQANSDDRQANAPTHHCFTTVELLTADFHPLRTLSGFKVFRRPASLVGIANRQPPRSGVQRPTKW
jgi:hypothetical protein